MSGDVVDWRDLKVGDRVEVMLTGVLRSVREHDLIVRFYGGRGDDDVSVLGDVADAATWRRLPDPLPTAPGAYILADVTRTLNDGTYPDTVRLVLVRQSEGTTFDVQAWWRSILPVNGYEWHRDEHIRSWAPVNLPEVSA
jgi:hypothetical protein